MKKLIAHAMAASFLFAAGGAANAQDINIGLIADLTGPLASYGRDTLTGVKLGLEYATGGTMKIGDRKIVLLERDDQSKPDRSASLLESLYADESADIVIGSTSSAATIPMLPVALEKQKVLVVEPAAADAITSEAWNRYVFRTSRNTTQDAVATAAAFGKEEASIAILAPDYSYGRDSAKSLKEAVSSVGGKVRVVHEEYVPQSTTDFTAATERLFSSLKDRPGKRLIFIVWAGAQHPLGKIAASHPERFQIELASLANTMPITQGWKQYTGVTGPAYYFWSFPNNAANNWLVTEHKKRFNAPPDFFTAGGMTAAIAVVEAIRKAGSTKTEALISAMEGMKFETPKGKMTFRPEDHQALQSMYVYRIKDKSAQKDDFDVFELVREITADEMPLPIRNKR